MITTLAAIDSPTFGAIHLGPLTIHMYALCILTGVVVAIWISGRRLVARGGAEGDILDLAIWAVPFGLVGGRLYSVFTTPEPYFGKNGHLINILRIWDGGLGIWGAVALGAVGVYIAAQRKGLRMSVIADAMAPGLIIAQGIGRVGNFFNNELYGGPTTLPWGLRVWQYNLGTGRAITTAGGQPIPVDGVGSQVLYHPTFLYELIWDVAIGIALILIDRRFKLGRGRVFALYVFLYCVGRLFVERLRIDHAEIILGQRLNVWTAILVGLGGLIMFFIRKGPRESSAYVDGREPAIINSESSESSPTDHLLDDQDAVGTPPQEQIADHDPPVPGNPNTR
ncbi:MAG: prolipoprotein diacylglyceryl transferase [Antricoccus sp.]